MDKSKQNVGEFLGAPNKDDDKYDLPIARK
jgi:hypothetical protein